MGICDTKCSDYKPKPITKAEAEAFDREAWRKKEIEKQLNEAIDFINDEIKHCYEVIKIHKVPYMISWYDDEVRDEIKRIYLKEGFIIEFPSYDLRTFTVELA
jgi:hypothetical protein